MDLQMFFSYGLHFFLILMLGHLVGDFLLQPGGLIKWKTESYKGILMHTLILFGVSLLFALPYIIHSGENTQFGYNVIYALLVIYAVHFAIDKGKILLSKRYPKFGFELFVLDQVLHLLVLVGVAMHTSFMPGDAFRGLFSELYYSTDVVLFLCLLVTVTYVWELVDYIGIMNKKWGKIPKAKAFAPKLQTMLMRGFVLCVLWVLLTPTSVFAARDIPINGRIDSVEPQSFTFGEEVVIKGGGFNEYDEKYSQVCWGSVCLHEDSILEWSEDEIRFEMTTGNMPLLGQLKVRQPNTSGVFTEELDGRSVTVIPTINGYQDMYGNWLQSLTAGQKIKVVGFYFGDSRGVITFDDSFVVDYESWSNEEIILTVPELPQDASTVRISRPFSTLDFVDEITTYFGLTDDEYSHLQTYLFGLRANEVWDTYDARGEGITIAILDDGVDITHPDLVHAIHINRGEVVGDGLDNDGNGYIDDVNGYDFPNDTGAISPKGDHGTHVAGVIAAKANNRIGIAGIAPEAKIMPLTVCDDGACQGRDVIEAMHYAVDNGADIINMSLQSGEEKLFDASYNAAMEYAHERGVIVVVAAGNGDSELAKAQHFYGRNFDETPSSPVCNDGPNNYVIGVAAIDNDYVNAEFSDYGSNCIDVSAFGLHIYSTAIPEFFEGEDNGTQMYAYAHGTSFATPQVSAALAIAMSEYPSASPSELKEALRMSGVDIDANLEERFRGHFGRALHIPQFMDYVESELGIIGVDTPDVDSEEITEELTAVEDAAMQDHIEEEVVSMGATSFPDVPEFLAQYEAITYLSDQGVLSGYDDGNFRPNNTVNRAELLKILVAGQGIEPHPLRDRNCFSDVKEEWFAKYVCYAKRQGWVEGYDDGTFRPEQEVNKVEALKMMIESYELLPDPAAESDEYLANEPILYTDVDSGAWYEKYLRVAVEMNLLEEVGGLFSPGGAKSRAAISENIFRILLAEGLDLSAYDPLRVDEFIK